MLNVDDWYCKVFLDVREDDGAIREVVRRVVGSTFLGQRSMDGEFGKCSFSLMFNKDSKWINVPRDPGDAFLYYTYFLDVEPVSGEAEVEDYLESVAKLLDGLTGAGVRYVAVYFWAEGIELRVPSRTDGG